MDLNLALASVTSAVIAAVIASLLIPLAIKFAEVFDAIDHPGERRHQATSIPRLGGIAIFLGIAIGGAGVALAYGYNPVGAGGSQDSLLSVMLATGLIFLLGIVDDIAGASVVQKLAVQIAAAVLLVRAGIVIETIGGVELGVWGPLLSIFWVVGVTNAINLLDGLDGLASGVVAIIAGSFLAVAVLQPNRELTVIFSAAIVGSCLGFLRHNWAPARVFMGDSGSLTLGFLMAALSIQSASKTITTISILVPILALGLPVVDTLVVMLVRFSRKGHNHLGDRVVGMFRPDREHFHHILERVGISRKRIVLGIYSLVFVFCVFGLVAVGTNQHLGVWLLVLQLLVVVGVRSLVALHSRSQRVSLEQESPSNVQEFSSPSHPPSDPPSDRSRRASTTA